MKMPKPVDARMTGSLLPYNSESGAQNRGPTAYPRTNNEVPSVTVGWLTPNLVPTVVPAGENTADAKVAVRELNTRRAKMIIFRFDVQF